MRSARPCHSATSHRHEPTHGTLAIGRRPEEAAQCGAPDLVIQPPRIGTSQLMAPSPLAGDLKKRLKAERPTLSFSHLASARANSWHPHHWQETSRNGPARSARPCHSATSHRHDPTHGTLAVGKRTEETAQRGAPEPVIAPLASASANQWHLHHRQET